MPDALRSAPTHIAAHEHWPSPNTAQTPLLMLYATAASPGCGSQTYWNGCNWTPLQYICQAARRRPPSASGAPAAKTLRPTHV